MLPSVPTLPQVVAEGRDGAGRVPPPPPPPRPHAETAMRASKESDICRRVCVSRGFLQFFFTRCPSDRQGTGLASDRLEACPPGTEVVRQASDSRPDRRILWLGPALTGLTLAPAWLNNPTCQGTSPPRWQRPQMMKMMKKLCAGSLPRRALASKRRARNWPRRVSRASPRSCGRPGSLAARHQARHQRRPHRKLSRRHRRISHRRRHGLAPQNPSLCLPVAASSVFSVW